MFKFFSISFLFCLATLQVSAENLLEIFCPDDVTTDCVNPYQSLDDFGKAYIKLYNDIQYIQPSQVVKDLNDCGAGMIVRIYQTSAYGTSLSCTQTITVTGNVDFEHYISWPRDVEVVGCDPDIHPGNFSISHRQPLFYDGPCTDIEMHYEDCLHGDYGDNCIKMQRLWTLIDHCKYDPNDAEPQGIYQYSQYIKIFKTDEPMLNIPHDVTLTSINCESVYLDLSSVTVSGNACGDPYVVTHDSHYADQSGIDASGEYPIGTTEITYSLPLGCWNKMREYSFKITVEKSQDCIDQEYEQSLKQTNIGGEVFMYHDYSEVAGVRVTVESDLMDTTFQMTYDTSMVEVIIDSIQGRIRGQWIYQTEMQMEITELEEMVLSPFSDEVMTNNQGDYMFPWLDDANYTVELSLPVVLDVDYTFSDMGYLYDYLEGRITDVSPYFLLAADIDLSGTVDYTDYDLLRELFNGNDSVLSDQDRFIVLPASHVFSDASAPWNYAFESNISQEQMRYADDDLVTMDYVCIPRGKFSSDSFTGNRSGASISGFSVYPNPFNQYVNVQYFANQPMSTSIQVYDIQGKLMHQVQEVKLAKGYSDIPISLDELSPGIYIIQIGNGTNVKRQKIIKS